MRDEILYQEVLELQTTGEWRAADALIDRLGDPLLLGHIQYQRYMHPNDYRAEYPELTAWLERHADHPGAERLYRLALKRRPAGVKHPPRPTRGYLSGAGQQMQEVTRVRYRTTVERSAAEESAVRAWRRQIEELADRRKTDDAMAEFDRADIRPMIDSVEADLARWAIARAYFYRGDNAAAFALAREAAVGSGETVPEIHWTAGASAWRLGRTKTAARHFAKLAKAGSAHSAERSRAAFWAARAYVVARKPKLVRQFLRIAAQSPQNLYGMLARTVLGETRPQKQQQTVLDEDRVVELLLRFPGARRALALGQIGRTDLAEREIRKLAAAAKPDLMMSLIALAESLNLPAAQMRLAQRLGDAGGAFQHGALYPVPSWRPASGFTVDRALVFAVMRAESGFDPDAESHAGARGLMQVMPATAMDIAARRELEPPSGEGLFKPETGMMFGQAYMEELLNRRSIGDNLIYIAAAYNAGPGRIARWQLDLQMDNDPLLFLESIPFNETRVYVKKVLTNLWNYRSRLGQPNPSLEALAHNRWPGYQAFDPEPAVHAWN